MRELLKNLLLAIATVSSACVIFLGVFFFLREFIGPGKVSNFLLSIKFPLSIHSLIVVDVFCIVILVVSIYLHNKYFL